jgi:hypothetical protein
VARGVGHHRRLNSRAKPPVPKSIATPGERALRLTSYQRSPGTCSASAVRRRDSFLLKPQGRLRVVRDILFSI